MATTFLTSLPDKIYRWLMPYHCILCQEPSNRRQDLCTACYEDLPFIHHACPRCASAQPHLKSNLTCGFCLKDPPPFDASYALFYYQRPITQLMMNLKFQHQLMNAKIIGELFAEKIKSVWYHHQPPPEVIIPVPLHTSRLKERGFNQALEIARPISKQLKIPIDVMSCIRNKKTAAQATLDAKDRIQNIKHAFKVVKPLPYHSVAVIDDVMTTSHTLREFCKTLKQQTTIQQIHVWCCARAAFS